MKVVRAAGAPRIDVGVDRRGEFFALRVARDDEAVSVVDADRDDRCLNEGRQNIAISADRVKGPERRVTPLDLGERRRADAPGQ